MVFPAPPRRAAAASAYGYEQRHDYRSMVDGAVLPCSIYKPDPAQVKAAGGDPARIPLWVELHAFGGHGTLEEGRYDGANMFVLSPWGRNYRSMYADGREKTPPEPRIFDDFDAGAVGWSPESGSWSASGGVLRQSAADDNLHTTARSGSSGRDYTVSVDLKEQPAAGDAFSAMGIVFRRQADGKSYVVGLADFTAWGKGKRLCLYRYDGGGFVPLAEDAFDWADGVSYNLKVTVFGDTIEVQVNNYLWALDGAMAFHNDDTLGPRCIDAAFTSGSVALLSMGGIHDFDNFRVQNEMLYGETDVIDCINQFIEEFSADPAYRVDPSRVYLSGSSMGGVGAWSLGLHYPDLFSALHPAFGCTDLAEARAWIKRYYPDDPPTETYWLWFIPFIYDFKSEQDALIAESLDAVLGGDPASSAAISSTVHEYSARWILENALNTPLRIEHPEYDSLLPNVVSPLSPSDNYMGLFWYTYAFPGAFRKFKDLIPTYAHADYVWKKWQQNPGLTACRQETSGYGEGGDLPPPPDPAKPNNPSTANIWDRRNYSQEVPVGAHCYVKRNPLFADGLYPARIWTFFNRATAAYNAIHLNPPEVAYKSYDRAHDRAWWLSLDIAYPDQDRPGLARARRDPAANRAAVHLKNVKTVTLDLPRMGLEASPAKALTVTLDANTAPEAEPLSDTWGKTDLRLAGTWWPGAPYDVRLNGAPVAYSATATMLTVPGVPTATTSTVTVTTPAGLTNLIPNPGFENGAAKWYGGNQYNGGTGGLFERLEAASTGCAAHGGGASVRIKDAAVSNAPFISSWNSAIVPVNGGVRYSGSAFVKTRALRGRSWKYKNGAYDTDHAPKAGVGILWFSAAGVPLRYDESVGITGTRDWTPVELSVSSPPTAAYAQLILYIRNPDGSGCSGSAFFDDAALR